MKSKANGTTILAEKLEPLARDVRFTKDALQVLLADGHEIVGVDCLVTGRRENLAGAFQSPNFTPSSLISFFSLLACGSWQTRQERPLRLLATCT